MDFYNKQKKNYLTYGSIISFMLDYSEINQNPTISYSPNNMRLDMSRDKSEDFADFLTSRKFIFSHGVFNDYCFFYKFKNNQDLKNNYLNTAFLVLPAFESDSMNNLNKIIKKIQKAGISESLENGVSQQQIIDFYTRFKQEIQTNHDKSLKLMKGENNKVNYNDSVQFLHLKSGKFLEFKTNNTNLKTYIQLTNNMSQRTIFRFIPAFSYQSETSTNVFYNLAIRIACGDKQAKKEKFMVNENVTEYGNSSYIKQSNIGGGDSDDEDEKSEIKDSNLKKSNFDGENIKNNIKTIYDGESIDNKVIDDIVSFSINESLHQKNLGVNLLPEENYVNADYNSFSYWILINFSEDYFEDVKYLNLFDNFCIQNDDQNLFIDLEIEENEEQNLIINENLNNTKKNLYTIKEENENKSENKSDHKDDNDGGLINQRFFDEKEFNLYSPKNREFYFLKSRNSINDSYIELENKIELNYFIDSNFYKNKKLNLLIESYEDKDLLKPYSLFKFEPVITGYMKGNFNIEPTKINIISDNISVRIINVFTNKFLYVDKVNKNKYKLFLVDNIEETDKRYNNTVFKIEQVKEEQETSEEESESSDSEEKNSMDNNGNSNIKETNNNYINKKQYIKIYSKRYDAYIGIRIMNENNKKELILTNSMSDITIFKLNCLDEEDKYELNFFQQLLMSFNNILSFYKKENKDYPVSSQNYERIKHIFVNLKNKLNQMNKDERDVTMLNLQENKFDFMDIINQFNIVSKLIEIFLTNWFGNYEGKNFNELEEYFNKRFFGDNKDALQYKLLISSEILEILTIIYNLNPNYLNVIRKSLFYFFMLIGRDDKCTKFLIHILRNNKVLLISICPLKSYTTQVNVESAENTKNMNNINSFSSMIDYNENMRNKNSQANLKYVNIKKCFERIIEDYNNMDEDKLRTNFSSLSLFFYFMYVLLTFDDNKPFKHIYNDYFKNLGILKAGENNTLIPSYEKNPILFDFFIKEDEIWVRKMPFGSDERKGNKNLQEFKLKDLIDIISNYNIETEEDRNKIFLVKLLNLNLCLYSIFSLNDENMKIYLKNIFKFDYITSNYLTFNYNQNIHNPNNNGEVQNNNIIKIIKTENPLMNDLKCSIINLLTYLYLKIPYPFTIKTHLFKVVNNKKSQENTEVDILQLKTIIAFINKILDSQENKFDIKKIDPFCLNQFVELIKYTLRNIYVINININEIENHNIYIFIDKILLLLEELSGISLQNNNKFVNDKEILDGINKITRDKLDLKDPIFLVSEQLQYVFLKYKNKLEEMMKKQDGKLNNSNKFLNLISEISNVDIIKNKYNSGDITKKNFKILKGFNLKSVLMDVSINSNRNNEFFKKLTLYTLEEIIYEFLQYLEYFTVEQLGNNINKNENINRKEFEEKLKNEIIINKNSTKYLDEFKQTKYNGKGFWISIFFLKFFQNVDSENLKNIALQIIYTLNSSKKLFYFNINNLVIFEDEEEYTKFIEIKNIFIRLIEIIKYLNLIQRLDKNSIILYKKFNDQIQILLRKLFDHKKWNKENNSLNNGEDFKFEDSIGMQKDSLEEDDDKESEILYEDSKDTIKESQSEENKKLLNNLEDYEEDSKKKSNSSFKKLCSSVDISENEGNKSNIFSFTSKNKSEEPIFESSSKDKSSSKSSKKESNSIVIEENYFLNDYDEENLIIIQQMLLNLDFIYIINEFFKIIDKLLDTQTELGEDLNCIEETFITIYQILVVFINKNEKNQNLVKDQLYLYICPLKIKKISPKLLLSINYFIFHLVDKINTKSDYNKINNIDIVINKLFFLHQLDWNNYKKVIPYLLKTLLIFFKFSSFEYIGDIFQLLEDILKFVLEDVKNGNNNNNSIVILSKLLLFIEEERIKQFQKEYSNRPLLSMTNIIKVFPNVIKLEIKNLKFSRPLILIINLIYDYYDNYKNDFEQNKFEILDAILYFCDKIVIKDSFIYKNSNAKKKSIKHFNEFMGISLPKLAILLSLSGISEEDCSKIFETSNKFYQKIYQLLVFDDKINIFLDKDYQEEIETILGIVNLSFLENILEKIKLFERSSNSLLRVGTSTLNRKELKKIYNSNARRASKRLFLEKDGFDKKISITIKKEENKKINKIAQNEINEERRNYIIQLFEYFQLNNNNYNENENLSLFTSYCKSFTQHYKDNLLKNQSYFFYWTNIIMMQYNAKEKNFEENETKYNNEFFSDLSIIEFTIERFNYINLYYFDYENLLYFKFLNCYLYKLDENNKANLLLKIIEKKESKNLFHLLHNIFNNLFNEIKSDINDRENNNPDEKFTNYLSYSFENEIDKYEEVLKFLCNISDNNEIIQNKMKDYLRIQYNNTKSHNFIIILSSILEIFTKDDNSRFIPKYYSIIIKIIEFITKCCNGPCKDNQDCVVKETHILLTIEFILKKLNYRTKKYYDDGLNQLEIGDKGEIEENENMIIYTNRPISVKPEYRKKLSYLKYKILVLLNFLTLGRKKGDKIYGDIHQIIDFELLSSVLIETYKEILIEKNAQENPDNLNFEEKMLSRMNDLDFYFSDEEENEDKFIIFEIGTYAYILINLYLDNLTRHINEEMHKKISGIRERLKKDKCKVKSESIFKTFIDFQKCLLKCCKIMLNKCGNCLLPNRYDGDFYLKDSFIHAYSFYFEYTPHIEILHNDKIIQYYIRLSPICKCLTPEMKEEFHENLDRTSAKTKTEDLFNKVEFFRYQLIINKKIIDAFSSAPILDLFFNHYKFYREIFLFFAILLNLLIFASYYRKTNDVENDDLKTENLSFDYGFLYEKDNSRQTKIVFLIFTIFEIIFACLILVNYLIFRVSYFLYYNDDKERDDKKKIEDKKKKLLNLSKNGELNKFIFERLGNFLLNLFKDVKLIYHLFLLVIVLATFFSQKFKLLAILLIDIIERSSTLMCIVKSFWIPRIQIIVTLFLFYLVAYYFIIFIYVFLPDQLPSYDCFRFSNCYFTLCDQTIKNSNGIINYLTEDGLYSSTTLWSNPRFWIDNWFAIIDWTLVIQMFCGIIIDTFLSQRETNKEMEDDKNNVCFICGLNKNELNKCYSGSEFGFNEHIRLDHYFWNYMFAIFNVTSDDNPNIIFLDKIIKEGYENKQYSSFMPYKKCLKQNQKKENEEEEIKEDEGED